MLISRWVKSTGKSLFCHLWNSQALLQLPRLQLWIRSCWTQAPPGPPSAVSKSPVPPLKALSRYTFKIPSFNTHVLFHEHAIHALHRHRPAQTLAIKIFLVSPHQENCPVAAEEIFLPLLNGHTYGFALLQDTLGIYVLQYRWLLAAGTSYLATFLQLPLKRFDGKEGADSIGCHLISDDVLGDRREGVHRLAASGYYQEIDFCCLEGFQAVFISYIDTCGSSSLAP